MAFSMSGFKETKLDEYETPIEEAGFRRIPTEEGTFYSERTEERLAKITADKPVEGGFACLNNVMERI